MDLPAILEQLNTLPFTFLRPGPTFAFLQNSKAAALLRYANAADGINANLSFAGAKGVWLDVWGKLFVIPRDIQEADDAYAGRIPATLVSGHGTPIAIILYMLTAFGYDVTITEDFNAVSWQLQFSLPITQDRFIEIMNALNRIRPAGVPATAVIGLTGGMYLGTINYLGASRVTGAYLLTPKGQSTIQLSAFTNSTKPLLPTLYLTDPTLNPGLAQ